MAYFEYSFVMLRGNHFSELLTACLGDLGFESFVEEEKVIKAYIPEKLHSDELKAALTEAPVVDWIQSYEVNRIEDQNWNAVWESEYDPVLIANRCLVRAPFHQPQPQVEYDIVIMPKMSFGTAHHETTGLMIDYLLDLDLAGKSFLDMGCGTAVLAILAKMRRAGPLVAIDNDEWAYNNSLENVNTNAAGDIAVYLGDASLLAGKTFDVIVANINRNILLNDIPAYAKCLTEGGKLLMSGFYESDLPSITASAGQNGLKRLSQKVKNNWTCAEFVKL